MHVQQVVSLRSCTGEHISVRCICDWTDGVIGQLYGHLLALIRYAGMLKSDWLTWKDIPQSIRYEFTSWHFTTAVLHKACTYTHQASCSHLFQP